MPYPVQCTICTAGVTAPDVWPLRSPSRLLPCDRAVLQQRSRSTDSLSSGHSSSGLGSDTGDLLARRRVTVKPLEQTDDDERWSYPR